MTSSTDNEIAKDRADWLLDAVATATQNRAFLRGDEQYDVVAGEAILANGEKAITVAIKRAQEAVLREMLDHIGHGKKIFPYLTVKDWLLAFAHEELGIALDGDGTPKPYNPLEESDEEECR